MKVKRMDALRIDALVKERYILSLENEDLKSQRDELLECLKDMVVIAHSDKWQDALSGRDIVLKEASKLIQKCNSSIENCK